MVSFSSAEKSALFALVWGFLVWVSRRFLSDKVPLARKKAALNALGVGYALVFLGSTVALGLPWESLYLTGPPVALLAWSQVRQTRWCKECGAYHPAPSYYSRVLPCRVCGTPL